MAEASQVQDQRQPAAGVYVSLDDLTKMRTKARGFSFLPRQPIHSLLAGRHASRLRGRGLNFEELRRYQPGDDIRQIDWKATIRTGKTQSRVYTEERERSVLLVVDQRRSMFFGSVRNMKSVTAAEAASLAAWRVLSQKDRVGALVFNDRTITEIRPQRSQAAVMQILSAIVEMNQALSVQSSTPPAPGQFNEVLRRCEHLAKHDCLICIISDGGGHNAETRKYLTRMSQHNDVLFTFIYDPMEASLPDAGSLVFTDGSGQMVVNTSSDSLRNQYRDTFQQKLADEKRFLLNRETPVILLDTVSPAHEQIRHQLGAARGRSLPS